MNARNALQFLRTTRGQLTAMGIACGGAVLLAVVTVCFLSDWFDGTVYEKFPEANRKLADGVAGGTQAADALDGITGAEFTAVYATYIDDPNCDPQRRLAAAMWRHQPERVLAGVRRTLVVGNRNQRLRALELLGSMSERKHIASARPLCQFAVRRASRRGEAEILRRASALLDRFHHLTQQQKGRLDERR